MVGNGHASATARLMLRCDRAEISNMGFLNYSLILTVMLLAVTLYVMRRRVRLGRRVPKF
jgi:hypothetical protein